MTGAIKGTGREAAGSLANASRAVGAGAQGADVPMDGARRKAPVER